MLRALLRGLIFVQCPQCSVPSTPPRLLSPKYPFIEAEIVFALRHEYALKAVDIVAR